MKRSIGFIPSFAVFMIAIAATSCASDSPSHNTTSSSTSSINADWFELDLRIIDSANYAVLYQVDRNRTVRFGGGQQALNDGTTWSGQLSEDDYNTLCTILNQSHWIDADPVSTNSPPKRITRVSLRTTAGRTSFTIKGENPHVRELLPILERATQARLNPDLETLPSPSKQ